MSAYFSGAASDAWLEARRGGEVHDVQDVLRQHREGEGGTHGALVLVTFHRGLWFLSAQSDSQAAIAVKKKRKKQAAISDANDMIEQLQADIQKASSRFLLFFRGTYVAAFYLVPTCKLVPRPSRMRRSSRSRSRCWTARSTAGRRTRPRPRTCGSPSLFSLCFFREGSSEGRACSSGNAQDTHHEWTC